MTGTRRVLVFGGTGFIGRHVHAALTAAGNDVSAPGRDRLDLVEAAPAALSALLAEVRPDVVVNAVGAVWAGDERRMRQLNLDVPRRLRTALADAPTHLVQLGSSVEYGPTPPGQSILESTEPHPSGAYASSKLAATRALLAAGGRPPVTVLRVFNAIGPGQPRQSLLGRVAAELATTPHDDAVHLTVDALRDSRDFVDVRDVARAVALAARVGPLGRVVNVGAGRARPVGAVLRQLIRISGRSVTLTQRAAAATARSVGIGWQQADLSLAGELLGWRPQHRVDTTLRDLWDQARAVRPASTGTVTPHLPWEAHDGSAGQGVDVGTRAYVPPIEPGGPVRAGRDADPVLRRGAG